ncbi:tape measure domain-containing protein [Pseudomonas lundensis]|nr:tape measure domain-containing protein [Pseudomonas lundensis]
MAGQEVQGMLIRLEATTAQLRQEMARADSSVAQVSGRIDRQLSQVDSAFDRVGLSAQRMGGILKGALAIGIGGSGIGALISQAEAYTQIANRLKLVTSSSVEFTAAQNAVFSIAQKSGQPLTATAELYQRIAQNQDALKLSGKGVAGIVETISKTMVISGASAASSEAALVQLGQAFASGTLRGEELNSVMEQAPALSQAIAKGMGVSVGALRALGAEGKLTAESVVQALQAQQGAVDALFGKMQDTIGTGLTRVQSSFTKMIGEGDKVGGMSSRISAALTSASRAMDAVTADGEGFTETIKNVGNALENVAYVGVAALTLGAGKLVASFAQSTAASVKQAGALVLTTKASLEAVTADAALARQSLVTAQTRQAEAAAMVERAAVELSSAEAKVASDRLRQTSEIGNIKAVQSTLVAERVLEEQRLRAQITDQGRAMSVARIAALRLDEVAITKQLQVAETSLAATTVATSAEITAALASKTAARGALAETTLTTNAASAASDRASAAASATAKATTVLTASGGGLLALLSGPVGLIAMTGLVAASFIDFGSSAKTATSALIDQNLTVDDSIAKFKELGAAQRTLQVSTWSEKQADALDEVGDALNEYAMRGSQAFQQLGMAGIEGGEKFNQLMEEVRTGSRSLNSVTEWVKENKAILPAYTTMLEQTAAAYEINGLRADKYGKLLGQVRDTTVSVTSSTEKLKVAQKDSSQTDASKAAWEKYIEQLTKTRDLLGANASAEAAYTAAKMGATPAQAAQAKLIADQTDTLKKYQDAIKEGDKVQQASLKLQLVALYTAEDAATQAAAAQKKTLDDTAKAAEESATRQVNAMQRIIDQTVRVATGQNMLLVTPPKQNLTGYGLLTNGGTAPAVPATPKATPLDRATAAIAQLDATTEANKRVDKAANAAATAIKNQEKALTDLLAKSGISTTAANQMADAYLAGADNVRAITIQQQIEEELLKTGAGARDKVTVAVNALQDAEDRRDVNKKIAEMEVEIDNTLKQATATIQGTAALEAFNIEKAVQAELIGKNIAIGSEEYKQLLATTKAQLDANKALESAGRIEGIIDRLNPEIKLLKDYEQAQQDIYAAMELAPGKTALYQDALVKLGNEYEVNRSKATIWGQMTEGAIDRIDEAFASAWGNIGSGAESLWDNLKKGFKQTLGEIAHMLTTKPLLASISNWLTGTDNGQGLGSVWSKLLGSASNSGGSSGGGMFSGMLGIGKNLMSAWNTITGVGSSVASGYASGGISGAISGGAGYYGNMLSNIASTLSSGFTTLIGGNIAITGATAAGTAATTAALTGVTAAQAAAAAATVGAEGVTAAMLSGAVAEGAASIGTNIGIAGATTAAASNGIGAAISSAMSSAAAMWPLAIVMGIYQSGKLYSAGVRPDASEMWDSAGSTALGKAAMLPQTVGAKYFEVTDNILGKVVGGKMAAILSGSTLFQAVWSKVGSKLFGSGYKTKDTGIELGVDGGLFDAQQYTKQKKKGGLLSGSSKTRYLHSALDAETQDALGSAYNEKILNSMGLFSALGVELSESVLDGLNMATTRISTQGKTPEAIQEQLDAWFGKLGDSAVAAINAATNSGLQDYNFEALTTFVNNLYSVNAAVESLGVKAVGFNVAGGKAVETMIAVSGGIEALTTGMNDYYAAFTTEMDRSADSLAAARAEFTKFGFTLPGTSDGLKDVVKGLDLTTEIGQNMFSAIVRNAKAAADAYTILEQRESAYRKAFFSEAENTALAIKGTTAELKALGVTLPASRSEYRKMVEEAAKSTTDTGKAMYDTLMNAAAAASTVFDELERRLNQGVTDSFSGVQRSISAQQKAATAAYNATNTSLSDMSATAVKSVTDLSSVSNSLESALKSLRGTSDDAVKTLRAQAQTTLQSALAAARAGGSLSGFSGLEDALDTVSSNNTDLYSSMEDFARDQGRTANVVAELNAINGKQLTAAEKLQKSLEDQIGVAKKAYDAQMAQYDQQLEIAQAQMDAFNGIDTSVKSVEAAIKALNGSLIASLAAKPATGAGSAVANTAANNATVVDTLYQQLFGRTADAGENKYWADRLSSGNLPYAEIVANMTQYASAADKAAMAAKGHATGGLITGPGTGTSDSILARLSNGEYVMTAEAVRMFGTGMLDQMNAGVIPAFATGGGIGEAGPQLEVTGPSRIFNANQTASMLNGGGGNGELIAEVRQLRTENRQAQFQIVKLTQKIEQTMSQWNGEGMPQEREYAL